MSHTDGPSLSAAEQRQLLVDWNATEMDLPSAMCLHEPIEHQARESPHAIALVCRDARLTYSELNARADRLALHLRLLGVGPETLVAVCLERSLEMVVALLGILKSGAAYVPLDPAYPKDRLAFMLEDSKPLVLVTKTASLEILPKTNSHVLCLDKFNSTAGSAPSSCEPAPAVAPHTSPLAYVIYTSGSTGKPKGVMVEHRNVLNFFAAMNARVPRRPNDANESGAADSRNTWLAITSPSFDISVLELLWTLSRGFKVVVYASDDARSTSSLSAPADYSIAALIQRHAVTHLQCTPSMASLFLLDEPTRISLGRLQTLLIGGELFPVNLARQLRKIVSGTILNMYGPTETTVWSTMYQLPAQAVLPHCIPVGRPIGNTQIYILDPNLQPVPIGAVGELMIGGAGVARGYLRRDQLTTERFIPNPFPLKAGPRLYRTGDLARYLPDGNIELLGRMDQQIKIRGHRVELGEIEALFNEHPMVRESVVLLRELPSAEKTLVAYVIPRDGQMPSRQELRKYAREKLPDHMVPTQVIFMTAFPQTPNKKIDRNAFPALAMASVAESDSRETAEPSRDGTGPSAGLDKVPTPVEEALARLWKELLGLEHVRPDDNFFECGGHSMLAMQLVAKVRKGFNIDFPLKSIFERQTLAGMAEIIEALSWSTFVKTPRTSQREVVDV